MNKLFVSALLLATILVKAEARAAAQTATQGGGPPGGPPPAGGTGFGGAMMGAGYQLNGPGGIGTTAETSAGAGTSGLRAGGIAGLVNANKKASCGRGPPPPAPPASTAAPATSAASA